MKVDPVEHLVEGPATMSACGVPESSMDCGAGVRSDAGRMTEARALVVGRRRRWN